MSTLDKLRKHSIVVADTGDFGSIDKYKPTDATTNPSLILQAASMPTYSHLIDEAVRLGEKQLDSCMDYVAVLFGVEILKKITGRVSTEVDARLSFSIEKSVEKAKQLIALYEKYGISKERVLIKLAATWEGIKAAAILEKEHGIHCNLTLIFSSVQAITCAENGVTLISPFVGRIYDYFAKKKYDNPFEDPGVQSVTGIYNYFKRHNLKTVIMGASFRNIDEIKCLTGCDLLTISPSLLAELEQETDVELVRSLDEQKAKSMNVPEIHYNEEDFRFYMNQDEMATFKLAEGIRKFVVDIVKLEKLIQAKIGN